MYNNFVFTKNIITLTTFNIAYNTKKKATKNYIIEIVSINISKTKIINIFFNSFSLNIIKI